MRDIYLEFYDTNFVLKGVLSTFYSLTWVQRFQELSTFDLMCAMTDELIAYATIGTFVKRSDLDGVFIIDSVQFSRDGNGNRMATIHGVDYISILGRRILPNRFISGSTYNLEHYIYDFLYYNTIYDASYEPTPLDNPRSLADYYSYSFTGLPTNTFKFQTEGRGNLLDVLYMLCKQNDSGIISSRTPGATKPVNFDFRGAVDKTGTVIFSEGMQNLASWSYSFDASTKANTIFTVGDNAGYWYNNTEHSGMDRFEYIADTGLSKTRDDGTEIPNRDYIDMLYYYGAKSITPGEQILDVETQNTTFVYPDDYTIGDMVLIKTPVASADALITEITEIFDTNGYSIFPTFKFI